MQNHEGISENLQFPFEKSSFSYSFATNCHRFRLYVVILLSFIFSPQGFHLLLSRLWRDKFAKFCKVFGSNPKGFELLKTYLAMFLRTSNLKRLNSFGAAENRPCCVQKNTSEENGFFRIHPLLLCFFLFHHFLILEVIKWLCR